MKLKLISYILFATLLINGTIQAKQSNLTRAKNMISGVKPYRKNTLENMYQFLNGSGLNNNATILRKWMNEIEKIEKQIETKTKKQLNSDEKKEYSKNKRNLKKSRRRMNAQVINEINQLFNTIDNITSNSYKEIIDFRKEKNKNSKKILPIQQEINTYKKRIEKLNKQLNQEKKELNKKLNNYYSRMKQSSKSLFKHIQKLGESMELKAKNYQTEVISLNTKINNIKKKQAKDLFNSLKTAQKNRDQTIQKIKLAINELSEAEQVRWSALRDLYNRVELVEQAIMYGSLPITKWKLPSHILRITPPTQ